MNAGMETSGDVIIAFKRKARPSTGLSAVQLGQKEYKRRYHLQRKQKREMFNELRRVKKFIADTDDKIKQLTLVLVGARAYQRQVENCCA